MCFFRFLLSSGIGTKDLSLGNFFRLVSLYYLSGIVFCFHDNVFLSILNHVRVLILGLGSSGGGAEAAEYYLKLGHDVEIVGSQERRENEMMVSLLESKGAVFIRKDSLMDAVDKADLVVKIPGVPVPYMVKKKAKQITNDIAALLENPKTERMHRIVIAGSKGKTSTASALSDALNSMGIRAAFSENLGYSAFHLLSDIENDDKLYDAVIVEMSMLQVKDTASSLGYTWPRIDIAAITDTIPIPSSPSDITSEGSLFIGPWVRKLIIPRFLKEKMLFSGIIPKAKVKGYPSFFNPFKTKPGTELAWECIKALGYRKKDITAAFRGYKGIPNRLELVAVRKGISFINDSSSVLPLSIAFSMRGMKGTPVHIIAGGTDKNNADAAELLPQLDEAVSITLLSGSFTEKLIPLLRREGLKFNGPYEKMEDAVKAAYDTALYHRDGRDNPEIILLSPGSYADEYFTNEFERGNAFRNAVSELLSEK